MFRVYYIIINNNSNNVSYSKSNVGNLRKRVVSNKFTYERLTYKEVTRLICTFT